ncbi:MAG: PDZ domain-containing protein [Flavobacteriales bacterium]|nr:PDZ domain-containing protein [Flavobacteriales bacterium]
MKERSKYEPLLYAILIGFGVMVGLFWNVFVQKKGFGQNTKIEQVMSLLEREYVDSLSYSQIEDRGISQMLQSFDPHSVYIPTQYVEFASQDLKANFVGVGVEFMIYRDTPYVVRVLQQGPAYVARVLPGDRILKADTNNLLKLESDKVIALIKGESKSLVKLNIYRPQTKQNLTVEVKRESIKNPSVYGFQVDSKTLYVKIEHFAENTSEEFVNFIEKSKTNTTKNLIIDLRNNTGGYLKTAIDILDEIVSGEELLAYTKSHSKTETRYSSSKKGICEDLNIAVLVNENSASASEIVSGALQDLDRALIIGSQTYGKGLVQETFQLHDGSQIRLTISRYYIPSGRSIQKPYDKDGYKHLDSLALAEYGKDFKTKNGRIVKSLGGITPDILLSNTDENYSTKNIGISAIKILDKNINRWHNMDYQTWVSSGQIDAVIHSNIDSTHHFLPVKNRLIYQLYGSEPLYQFELKQDEAVKRALQEFSASNKLFLF